MSAGASAAAVSAASAAAKAARRRREEEEEMTNYSEADLAGEWKFKILRSITGAFRKPEIFRRTCEEEAKAGWQLVEKFDNERLRFKRLTSAGTNDYRLDFDPYRTYVGMSPGRFFLAISAASIATIPVWILILFAIIRGL